MEVFVRKTSTVDMKFMSRPMTLLGPCFRFNQYLNDAHCFSLVNFLSFNQFCYLILELFANRLHYYLILIDLVGSCFGLYLIH